MVFSAQEFQWITGINLATQYLVYLPLMLLVETKAFGEVSLFQLQLPGLVQGLVGLAAQLCLLCCKVLPRLWAVQAAPRAVQGQVHVDNQKN